MTTPSRPTTGGAQTLLYAVGAAVIGGTSLFGGRGKIYDAVTGGLVVAIIANGLPLVTQKSGVQFIINGLVLLLAASVDAISRRRAAAHRKMIRWGILSTARIADRILEGARLSETAQIVAVGSRDVARAQAYAAEKGIERAHGSYEDLLADPGRRRRLHPAAELHARAVVDRGARGRQARAVREAADAGPRAGRAGLRRRRSAPTGC